MKWMAPKKQGFGHGSSRRVLLTSSDIKIEETAEELEPSFAEHVRNLAAEIEIPSNVCSVTPSNASHVPSSLPASQTWPGKYGFTVSFRHQEKNTKGVAWTYSEINDKLYVGKDVPCPINFSANTILPEGVTIRTMALFTSPEQVSEIVHRCVNHSMEEYNRGLVEAEHLIRCESPAAEYSVDSRTGRHSVIVPFENPPDGQSFSTYIYKFACFTSCSGGPNRRPLMLIFTLEKGNQVLGRKKLDIKICACPGRDRKTEESQHISNDISLPVKRKVSSDLESDCDKKEQTKSVFPPLAKKIKTVQNKDGSYTITVFDKGRYEFLKEMSRFYDIHKMVKTVPSEAFKMLLHHHKKKSGDKSD